MVLHEPPTISVFRRRRVGRDPLRTIVWVRGEHDIATRVHLSVSIARAARLDDADVVVDLSGVTFMDASTVGALVLARNRLRGRSQALSLRAPPPRARRLLELCGLERLIDDRSAPQRPPAATALGSWVAVPASGGGPHPAPLPVAQESAVLEPARATARRRVAPDGAVQQRRAPP